MLRATSAMTRSPRRTGIDSTRTGTSSRHSGSPSRTSRPLSKARSSSGRRPVGTNVPTTSSTSAVGPVVGRICPAAQNPSPLAVGQPEHQVGEGQVGDDLPVRHQQLQPLHVLVVEVRVAAHQVDEGRHRTHGSDVRKPLGRTGSPPEPVAGCARMTRAYWSQVKAGGLAVPDDRPLADLTTELTTMLGSPDPSHARRPRVPDAGHLGRPRGVRRPDHRARRRHGRRPHRRPRRAGHRLGVPACVLGARAGRVHRPRQPGGPAPRRQAARVGRPDRHLVPPRADLRGFVAGKGWAHTVAHGADAIGVLGAVARTWAATS